jgi:hypothetical protein
VARWRRSRGSLVSSAISDESVGWGVVLMDKTDGPFHLSAQDCSGSVAIGADGKFENNASSCSAVDKDGDTWWLEHHIGPQGPQGNPVAWVGMLVVFRMPRRARSARRVASPSSGATSAQSPPSRHHCASRVTKRDMATVTLASYRRVLDGFWRPHIGSERFLDLRYSTLVRIADNVTWSKKSYNNAISILRRAFGYRDHPEKHDPTCGLSELITLTCSPRRTAIPSAISNIRTSAGGERCPGCSRSAIANRTVRAIRPSAGI